MAKNIASRARSSGNAPEEQPDPQAMHRSMLSFAKCNFNLTKEISIAILESEKLGRPPVYSNVNFEKLVRVAKMYYEDGCTQEKIAKSFSISRSAVSTLLAEAKSYGIVQITIQDFFVNNDALSSEFESRFGLKRCIVMPSSLHNDNVFLRTITLCAATYLAGQMRSHSSLGVGWGTACYSIMRSFPDDTELYDVTVVPLVGGSTLVSPEYQLNEIIRVFAEKLHGTPLFIHSPWMTGSLRDRQTIMESHYMKPIIQQWATLDCAVVGIGRPSICAQRKLDHTALLKEVKRYPNMSVGDLCARRLNIAGEMIPCDFNNKLIGISEQDLRKTSSVMAVAIGDQKILSIIGALNSGLIDHFATDEATAKQVLKTLDDSDIKKILAG